MNLVQSDDSPEKFDREIIGGKGHYLLQLIRASHKLKTFQVPNFFIIPVGYENIDSQEIRDLVNNLPKPLAVRSSAPLEDGVTASFAGMYSSFLNINSYGEFVEAYRNVIDSANAERVHNYAERMGIDIDPRMAVIVQQQVVNPWLSGTIQLEGEGKSTTSRCEFKDRKGKDDSYEFQFKWLEDCTNKRPIHKPRENPEWISEGDYWTLSQAAHDVREELGLDDLVQVETCFSPDKPIDFVQVRQLPQPVTEEGEWIDTKKIELESHFNLKELNGTPYIVSDVCNGVPSDISLPAYVTVSQAGTKILMITFGLGIPGITSGDERADIFYEKSNLHENHDFHTALNTQFSGIGMIASDRMFDQYNNMWRRGNTLFENYILVCDKLDESICGMNDLTSNKKAIITCNEEIRTSHAMTVATELGIPCIGVNDLITDINMTSFYHQVQSGDIVRIKSDGRRAIAYIEQKRTADPYNTQE